MDKMKEVRFKITLEESQTLNIFFGGILDALDCGVNIKTIDFSKYNCCGKYMGTEFIEELFTKIFDATEKAGYRLQEEYDEAKLIKKIINFVDYVDISDFDMDLRKDYHYILNELENKLDQIEK